MVVVKSGTVKTAKHNLEIRTLYKDTSGIQQEQQAGNSSKASVEPNGTYEDAAGLDTLPSKVNFAGLLRPKLWGIELEVVI